MMLWSGRLGQTDSRVNDFNSSISFDSRMAKEDIEGSIAHVTMLGAVGVLPAQQAQSIAQALSEILEDLMAGRLAINPQAEDIHTFVEEELTRRLGQAGKMLHTARSRNDQVAVDLRCHLRGQAGEVAGLVRQLALQLCSQAESHLHTVMPGYTHMQRAQPITLGHHLMAYVQMLLRDLGRIGDAVGRMNQCPLGCGALAGTTYPIDREMTARALGFDGACENSLDGVSDRDFCIELCSALAMVMMHLSRFCEELILWCSWEFRFAELSDEFSTGSSIMPQKKNPDVPELIRGKTARVYGDLMTLLSMMKSLPLAYNKDLQEDKEAIFDAVDTVKICLSTLIPLLQGITFYPEAMRRAAAQGFINATDCADYLVRRGLPFRDAYHAVGQLVRRCLETGQTLETLPLSEYQAACPLFEEGVYQAIDLLRCVDGRRSKGGPAPEEVQRQIAAARAKLAQEGTA